MTRRRLVAWAIAVDVVVLFALEGGARLVSSGPSNTRFDVFSGLAVHLGLESLNQVVEPDPTVYWKLRRSLPPTLVSGRVGASEMRFTVSTTAEGRRTVPTPPRAASRTVVCLGDSCTFGVGVDDGETYPARLQELLGDARVVNAGVPAYSAYQGRRVLESSLDAWRPSAVTIQFGFNDASDWGGRSDLEPRPKRSPISWLVRHSRFLQLLVKRRQPATTTHRPRLTPEEFAGELGTMIRLCREHGGTPVLVRWVLRSQADAGSGTPATPHQEALLRVSREERVAVADLLPVFGGRKGEGLFVDVVHATAEGNRLAAETIEKALPR